MPSLKSSGSSVTHAIVLGSKRVICSGPTERAVLTSDCKSIPNVRANEISQTIGRFVPAITSTFSYS